MPYNNTAIPPPEEVTGTSSLPLTRVKKIIAMDEDIAQCSNSAAFAISVATEIFIRYLTEQAHNVVKSERKPRRNIQYKDFANAVSRIDNLEFLADVIPKTTTYKQFKDKKARDEAAAATAAASTSITGPITPGQTTFPNGFESELTSANQDEDHEALSQRESNGVSSTPRLPPGVNGNATTDRTFHSSTHGHPQQAMEQDIEMS